MIACSACRRLMLSACRRPGHAMIGAMETAASSETGYADRPEDENIPLHDDGCGGIAVVIDYQNMHLCGWDSYAQEDAWKYERMLDPVELALTIAGKEGKPLKALVVCRGLPDKDRKAYWYDIEQHRVWKAKADDLGIPSKFIIRKMRKCDDGAADGSDRIEEKGIDIACALEFIDLAYHGGFDDVVLCSHDTDFIPALEKAVAYGAAVSQAYWKGGECKEFYPLHLNPAYGCQHTVQLTEDDYRRCLDRHSWSHALDAAPKHVRDGISTIRTDPVRVMMASRIAGSGVRAEAKDVQ